MKHLGGVDTTFLERLSSRAVAPSGAELNQKFGVKLKKQHWDNEYLSG